MEIISRKVGIILTAVICLLIVAGSLTGFLFSGIYINETRDWPIPLAGQRAIGLSLIVPVLVVSVILIFDYYRAGARIWAGCLLYLLYAYLIYCINVHFKGYFIEYCLILGVSFFSLLYYLYVQVGKGREKHAKTRVNKVLGVYFIVLPLVFYMLWLSDVLPAVYKETVPDSVYSAGLFTNPVQVIDLSVMLPGIFITGLLLIKGHRMGVVLVPVILTFFVLMDVAISMLAIFMGKEGVGSNISVAIIMALLCLLGLMFFFIDFRSQKFSI